MTSGRATPGCDCSTEVDFDVMKIDLSLVQAGAASGTSDAVLGALKDLAGRRRQSIVAEGVETVEQLELVVGLGFDAAQGYLLGRPSPRIDVADIDLNALLPRPASPAGSARAGRVRRAATS